MQLTGYLRRFRKRPGGIRRIALIRADKIYSGDFDYYSGSWRSFTLMARAGFVTLTLPEDRGSISQTASMENGMLSVRQRVEIPLEGLSQEENIAVEAIMEHSYLGITALVETQDGEIIVAGYSPDLKAESGLKPIQIKSTSQEKPSQSPLQTIVLSGVDNSHFKLYSGDTGDIFN